MNSVAMINKRAGPAPLNTHIPSPAILSRPVKNIIKFRSILDAMGRSAQSKKIIHLVDAPGAELLYHVYTE